MTKSMDVQDCILTKDLESLCRAVGREVLTLVVRVLFYSVETRGALGSVSISLVDGAQFVFGCAGDGSVSVTRKRGDPGTAPGFAAEVRTIAGVCGELQAVSPSKNALRLVISKREVLLVNEDDELAVFVDGKALPPQIFMR